MTLTEAAGHLVEIVESEDADLCLDSGQLEAVTYAAAILGMFVEALEP